MADLATFAAPSVSDPPLWICPTSGSITVGQNLLLKSHPAHEDAMGESALFTSPHREYPSISDAIT